MLVVEHYFVAFLLVVPLLVVVRSAVELLQLLLLLFDRWLDFCCPEFWQLFNLFEYCGFRFIHSGIDLISHHNSSVGLAFVFSVGRVVGIIDGDPGQVLLGNNLSDGLRETSQENLQHNEFLITFELVLNVFCHSILRKSALDLFCSPVQLDTLGRSGSVWRGSCRCFLKVA